MLLSILSFIVILSTVVVVHEFGHFLAARRAGVPVYEFSIGFAFSPRIVTFFRSRETEFTLRLLPLGGFVSFSKEGDEDAALLLRSSTLSRASILAGGPFFNICFAVLVFIPAFMLKNHVSLLPALLSSLQTAGAAVAGTGVVLTRLFTGQSGMESLAGPVGIAIMAGQAASRGVVDVLFFTGSLSISLGIMNLLPLPGLDGGQLTMLLVEKISNKSLDAKTHQLLNFAGIMLFLLLSLIVT
ncbi:MAG: site-2 protease family protein [Chlorobiaceae bacterium]|nr:site-2 protease family protein [Chlorobiaceae bacterium]